MCDVLVFIKAVCVIISWYWFCRVLPHSLVDETTAVCLFVADVDRNDRDFAVTVDKYRELLDDAAVKPQIDVFAILDFSVLTTVSRCMA